MEQVSRVECIWATHYNTSYRLCPGGDLENSCGQCFSSSSYSHFCIKIYADLVCRFYIRLNIVI